MKTPNEQYVEIVARSLHGKYGAANQVSWTSLKDEVREQWLVDARELLDELRPDLRYVSARGQDHYELSEALGVEPGLLEWSRLLDLVREQRSVVAAPTGEFARIAATTDVVRAVLQMLSAEYAEPHAHSDDDSAYAEDLLLDAARRLVAARAGEDTLMGSASPLGTVLAPLDPGTEGPAPVQTPALDDLLSAESIRDGIAHGHPAVYPLPVQPLRSWRDQL